MTVKYQKKVVMMELLLQPFTKKNTLIVLKDYYKKI